MEETIEFMEEFMLEMSRTFPNLLIQFEDFATDKVCLPLSPQPLVLALTCVHVVSELSRHLHSLLHSATVTPYSTMISKAPEVSSFPVS